MRILVTGGAGFIGSNLARYLLQRGVQVRVLDNLTIGKERIAGLDLDLIEGDIRDPQCVSMALDKCDGVVHLAAQSGVQQSLEDPVKDCQINIIGLLTVLEECRKLQSTRLSEGENRNFRFVMASSNASLGRHEPPVDEKSTPLPLSPYGASKLAGEGYSLAYQSSFGIDTVVLRFSNVYGPFSTHKESVIAKFIKDLRQHGQLFIDGDGLQTRDFIHTDDLCAAIYQSLRQPISGEVIHISSGKETSILELAETLEGVTGISADRTFGACRTGDIRRNYAHIEKAIRVLKWSPQVVLEEGLKTLWRWYEKLEGNGS